MLRQRESREASREAVTTVQARDGDGRCKKRPALGSILEGGLGLVRPEARVWLKQDK